MANKYTKAVKMFDNSNMFINVNVLYINHLLFWYDSGKVFISNDSVKFRLFRIENLTVTDLFNNSDSIIAL
jgi:hypothetical protein